MSRALVLALDGSTRTCSAAVLRKAPDTSSGGWEVLARSAERDARGQAKILLRAVDEMLTSLEAGPADLRGIVVGTGPGTFTGVRIAVATARGLALSLGIPIVGISTIALLAAAAVEGRKDSSSSARTCVVPIVDAHRQQVFHAAFNKQGRAGNAGRDEWVRTGSIEVCGRGELGDKLADIGAEKVMVVGEDRELAGELPQGIDFMEQAVAAEFLVIGQEYLQEPIAPGGEHEARSWLSGVEGEVDTERTSQGGDSLGRESAPGPWSPERVRPLYVRAPDADIHITKMKDPWGDGS